VFKNQIKPSGGGQPVTIMKAIITLKSLKSVKTTDFIFIYIENKFNSWFSHNVKNNSNIRLAYFGSGEQKNFAVKKGAILQAIEYIALHMEDENLEFITLYQIEKIDYEVAFEI
jgi:CRISPR/Cas system-associated protein Csx1